MLRKLMKHELRASGRIMLPMLLLVLVTAAGANVSTRTLLDSGSTVLVVLGTLFMTAFALAIAALCFLDLIIMIQRFYTNLLQDEGYVMMTLPVSVHEHVISKLLVSMLWCALSILVVIAAFFILVYDVGLVHDILDTVKSLLNEVLRSEYFPHIATYSLELLALIFFGGAAVILKFYAAMAIGFSFSSKKILMSIVVYFGIEFAKQIIMGIVMGLFSSSSLVDRLSTAFYSLSNVTIVHIAFSSLAVFMLIYAALLYFPTTWFLKHRLNLE